MALGELLLALDPGAGGVNVARVLHRFGVQTRAVLPAGGVSGRELLAEIEREGALRLGVAAGAAACMAHGSELCRPEDVWRLDRELPSASQPPL